MGVFVANGSVKVGTPIYVLQIFCIGIGRVAWTEKDQGSGEVVRLGETDRQSFIIKVFASNR